MMMKLWFYTLCWYLSSAQRWESSRFLDEKWMTSNESCPKQHCSNNENIPKVFWDRPCFCDNECLLYHDCCWDYDLKNALADEHNGTLENGEALSCPDIRRLRKDMVYVIDYCPDNFYNMDIVRRCKVTGLTEGEYSYMLDIPVLSKDTNTTYRNIYCALCFNDSNLVSVRGFKTCNDSFSADFLSKLEYIPSELTWFKDNSSCSLFLDLQESVKYGRRCVPAVTTCNADWNGAFDEQEQCTNSNSLYVVTGQRVYRNPYCALCNFVSTESLKCLDYLSEDDDDASRFGASYAVVLDFSWTRCKENEIFDPFLQQCQKIPCQNCHQHCNRTYLKQGEFKIIENGSLIIIDSNAVVNSDYYFKNGNLTEVVVCDDNSSIFHLPSDSEIQKALRIMSGVMLSASCVCLTLHIIFFCLLPDIRNSSGKGLLCLVISLLIAQLIFLFGTSNVHSNEICIAISLLLHYFYLCVFTWMTVISIDVCRTITKLQPLSTKHNFKYVSCNAWLSPVTVILSGIILQELGVISGIFPKMGAEVCFFGSALAHGIFFVLPSGILLSINIILFLVTVINISNQSQHANLQIQAHQNLPSGAQSHRFGSSVIDTKRKRFLIYLRLSLLMGLTWCTGFAARLFNYPALWFPFVILNGLAGVFIFIAFDLKRKYLTMMKMKFSRRNLWTR